jgi:K(+)-stimulated pyrophosphate-energized sodium pump
MPTLLAAEGGYQIFKLGSAEKAWLYFCIAVALLALVAGYVMMKSVLSKDAGTEKMNEIAGAVQEGAMAYIKRQFRTIGFIVVPLAAVVFATSTEVINPLNGNGLDRVQSGLWRTVAFLVGALFSGFIGFVGMWLATRANVRTAAAAKTGSMDAALQVAFRAGGTIGLFTAGLGLLGATTIVLVFQNTASSILIGFGFGGSLLALFLRVGGGIFTKAADVGADLVGKVEAGIPEDDPRNPATIADNVGDNVGDVAGMGADLFGSYVATMLATMVLGREVVSQDNFDGMAPILLPMVIAGLGIIFSIIGTFFVRIKGEDSSVMNALNLGNWSSMVLTAVSSYFVIQWMLPETMSFERNGSEALVITSMNVFWSIILGLVVGTLMSIVTEYYTSMGRRPVDSIVQKSGTGHGTNVIGGLAVGMESTVLPILILAAGIYGSFELAGLYGVAIAAAGMMATTAMQLAIDAFGPIADNAGGIAEMSHLPSEVRERTDNLDAVGNTTAATGKGFAIASAALTALALFAAYVGLAGIDGIDIYKADVLAMLFVGAMIPFFFSSLAISAVGKAAMEMVREVRRQFREIPGIMEGTGKPEYEKCVEISTKASIREMVAPGALALIAPILVGFTMGPEALGGLLAGITVSGVLMGMFQNNAGGAWDNAKKSFEKGVVIDGESFKKGSEPHKAAVTGDTVGDPFKDTSGPSMNILIKLTSIVALVIAPFIAIGGADHTGEGGHSAPATEEAAHVCTPECMSSGTCPMHLEAPAAEGAEAGEATQAAPAEGDAASHSCTKECTADGGTCPHHA